MLGMYRFKALSPQVLRTLGLCTLNLIHSSHPWYNYYLSSAQQVNNEHGQHCSHIWKLIGFVHPLCGSNFPISLPTRHPGRKSMPWLYIQWPLGAGFWSIVLLTLKNLLQAALSTCILFGVSFHCMYCYCYCACMLEGVKQLVLSVCQFVSLSVQWKFLNLNIDRVKWFLKLTL